MSKEHVVRASTWKSWVIGSPELIDVDASRVLVLFVAGPGRRGQ